MKPILYRLISYNFIISIVLCLSYLLSAKGTNPFFFLLALGGNFMLFYGILLLLFSLFYLLCKLVLRKFTLAAIITILVMGVFFSLFHIFFIIDFIVFRIWSFHLNLSLLGLFTSGIFGEIITLGYKTWTLAIILVLALVLLEAFVVYYSYKKRNKKFLSTKVIILVIFSFILIDKGVYIAADFVFYTRYLRDSHVVPFYIDIMAKDFITDMTGYQPTVREYDSSNSGGTSFYYPKHPMVTNKKFNKNVIMIFVDTLRSDMVTPEIMPNTYKFMKQSSVFTKHYSNGNATRCGIFSLFYSSPCTYFNKFYKNNQAPVLFKELFRHKYNVFLGGSASFIYPNFRATTFSDVVKEEKKQGQQMIYDDFKGSAWKRDIAMRNEYLTYIKSHKTDKPFFSFIFFDAVHSRSYPEKYAKFLPTTTANYITTSNNPEYIQHLKNGYQNSVFYVDSLIGNVLDELKKKKLFDKSIIILSSDHGQEFFETGHFGHNSAFSEKQMHIPFIVHLPDSKPKVYSMRTDNSDVIPTIMHMFGYTNAFSDYSFGQDLFDPAYKEKESFYCESWGRRALVYKDYIIVKYRLGIADVYDYSTYKTFDSEKANRILKEQSPALLQAQLRASYWQRK